MLLLTPVEVVFDPSEELRMSAVGTSRPVEVDERRFDAKTRESGENLRGANPLPG